MKNVLKTVMIAALFCVPQVGHAVRPLKYLDRFLGLAGFATVSWGHVPTADKLLKTSVPFGATAHDAEVYQAALEVRELSSHVGLQHNTVPSFSLRVAKNSEPWGASQDENGQVVEITTPLSSPMVQAVEAYPEHDSRQIIIAFNEDYFSLPRAQKMTALASELVRIKNYEREKALVAGAVLPFALTVGTFRAAGKGITTLLSQSQRFVRNKYGALGLKGLNALSKSFLLPFASTALDFARTQYEYDEHGANTAITKSFFGPSVSLWNGYQFKSVAAYNRYRTRAMDAQATKIVGKNAMIEYLSQPGNESKVRYVDPAYAPTPSFKERLEAVRAKTA